MLYAIICNDKPGHLPVRKENRPAHVAYLNGLVADGRLKLAGPFLDPEGNPCGSLLVVEADSESAARALSAGDPYAKAGVFETVEVRPWNWTINKPE